MASANRSDPAAAREAVAWQRTAIALRPTSAVAHNNLGVALEPLGDRDAVEAAYRRAIRLAPEFVVAHLNLAHLLLRRGDPEAAVAETQRVVARFPDSAAAYGRLAPHPPRAEGLPGRRRREPGGHRPAPRPSRSTIGVWPLCWSRSGTSAGPWPATGG